MEHTGSNFRYLREMVGISRKPFGEIVGVSGRTVTRWSEDETYPPPDIAWQHLDTALENLTRMYSEKLEAIETRYNPDPGKGSDGKRRVTLAMYDDQDQYDRYGSEKIPYTCANKWNMHLAAALMAEGFTVDLASPAASAADRMGF